MVVIIVWVVLYRKLNAYALYTYRFQLKKEPVKLGFAVKYIQSFYGRFMSREKINLFGKGSEYIAHFIPTALKTTFFILYIFQFSHIMFNLKH